MSTTTSLPQPLSSFDPFPNLPFELRTIIWKFALLFGPKVVTISTPEGEYESLLVYHRYIQNRADLRYIPEYLAVMPGRGNPKTGIRARYQMPALLQVNQESRELALATFDAAFSQNLNGGPPVYFNFAQDALHFADQHAFATFYGEGNNQWNYRHENKVAPKKEILVVSFNIKTFDNHFFILL